MNVCDLVWNEYQLVYSTYESFNGAFLTIKGWSVTVALVSIFAVYIEKLATTGKVVLWLAALSALPFWLVDTFWKAYQSAYLSRIAELEAISGCSEMTEFSLGAAASWRTAYEAFDFTDWVEFAALSAFPHVFVIGVGIFLVLFFPPISTKPALASQNGESGD